MIAVPPTILDDFSIPHLHPLCWAPVVADAAVVVACPAVVPAAVDPEVLQIWKKRIVKGEILKMCKCLHKHNDSFLKYQTKYLGL